MTNGTSGSGGGGLSPAELKEVLLELQRTLGQVRKEARQDPDMATVGLDVTFEVEAVVVNTGQGLEVQSPTDVPATGGLEGLEAAPRPRKPPVKLRVTGTMRLPDFD